MLPAGHLRIEVNSNWWKRVALNTERERKGKQVWVNLPNGQVLKATQTFQTVWQNQQCVICGAGAKAILVKRHSQHWSCYKIETETSTLTKDHIIPKEAGGPDHLLNYQTMCSDCNRFKGRATGPVFCIGFARYAMSQNCPEAVAPTNMGESDVAYYLQEARKRVNRLLERNDYKTGWEILNKRKLHGSTR